MEKSQGLGLMLIGILVLNLSACASSQPTNGFVGGSSCQCKLEYNVISCQPNVIANFPADLINSCPEFIDKLDQVQGKFHFGFLDVVVNDLIFPHDTSSVSLYD